MRGRGFRWEAKLVAYHAAGAAFLPEVPAYGTASSVAYNTTGGGAALVSNFKNAFGESFDAGICGVDHVLEEGEVELAGIRFAVKPNAEAFDLEIPELDCVYIHMMGHDCHSIVAGCRILRGRNDLPAELLHPPRLRPGAHGALHTGRPEGREDKGLVSERDKEIALTCKSAAEMKQKVEDAYPGNSGLNYLDMTVGFFFPGK
ncbi:MAG: hypothetical protein V8T00_01115 [Oscillospiraceae bacterium]